MSFRFVHVADVHLDSPFCARGNRMRQALRDAVRSAFQCCVETAIKERAHALLIAGDLFDSQSLSFATERLLIQELARLKEHGVRVFYAPGNHDPYGSGYRLSSIRWPENVVVFNSWMPSSWEVALDGRCVAVVTGAGHENAAEARNLVEMFPAPRQGVPNIGVVHALVEGVSGCQDHERYAPCSRQDLETRGYAYWALGHVHTRSENWSDTVWIYPGSLVGKNRRETGMRGAYLVEIDDLGGVHVTFRGMSPLVWCTVVVSGLEKVRDLDSLLNAITREAERQLAANGTPVSAIVTVQLEGACPLYRELQEEDNLTQLAEDLASQLRMEFVEVRADSVHAPVKLEPYLNAPSLAGEFLRLVERARGDDNLLLQLAPEPLAGLKSHDPGDKLAYLKLLLDGIETEGLARLLGGIEGCASPD
ncbi:MAG: metallophosphoesterase family protein [Bacillota bacterium]